MVLPERLVLRVRLEREREAPLGLLDQRELVGRGLLDPPGQELVVRQDQRVILALDPPDPPEQVLADQRVRLVIRAPLVLQVQRGRVLAVLPDPLEIRGRLGLPGQRVLGPSAPRDRRALEPGVRQDRLVLPEQAPEARLDPREMVEQSDLLAQRGQVLAGRPARQGLPVPEPGGRPGLLEPRDRLAPADRDSPARQVRLDLPEPAPPGLLALLDPRGIRGRAAILVLRGVLAPRGSVEDRPDPRAIRERGV